MAATMPLDAVQSPLPLHRQIREALRSGIRDGTYQQHAQLPSESELMAIYKVSRITVRHALAELQREGLIFKITGKGTFVSKNRPKAMQDLSQLQGFSEAMHSLGRETSSQVLGYQRLSADGKVATRLGLQAGDVVIELKRLRYLDRLPISLDVSYFPVSIGEQLLTADLTGRDVFSILENELGMALGTADVSIEAALAGGDVAAGLGIDDGEPLLRIERLTTSLEGRPLDFEYLYCRGDAMRYRVRLPRAHAARNPEDSAG